MMFKNKVLYTTTLLTSLISLGFSLEYQAEDLRTRPLQWEDQQFWYNLHASQSVCSYFRDGKTRTADQVDFQFVRSLARYENNDPRYIHVIERGIGNEWIPVGTVVLGGSEKPNFLECAILMHPIYDSKSKCFIDDKNINSSEQVQKRVSEDTQLVAIWGEGIASRIAKWGLNEYTQDLRKKSVSYKWFEKSHEYHESFDGNSILGILATTSHPISKHFLEKHGFSCQGEKEDCKWGQKYVYEYKFSN
ncbi:MULTISPECIES: hypothetical protein [Cysteiniphilum]|uniref:hypothetical protein n=1 Tax=Cysteiniphilum TaxID=2056696 RepID=UPI00177E0951|nr:MULTISPECIES: hypothetical protein [Cysteiniphilum]